MNAGHVGAAAFVATLVLAVALLVRQHRRTVQRRTEGRCVTCGEPLGPGETEEHFECWVARQW
jgi:hypothetical protein